MEEPISNMSVLTKAIVDARIKGQTIEEVANDLGIKTEEAVIEWKKYVATRNVMPKEEQWVIHLLRLEELLYRVNSKLTYSTEIKDYEVVLNILSKVEELQSLNLSRKEVAELEAEKMHRLQAEQLIGILEMSRLMMRGMIEDAFDKHKTLKAAKANLLEDLGEFTTRALGQLEEDSNE